jgi:hypothetical protein
MQTRIIDGREYGKVNERGIVVVVGSDHPSPDEKIKCRRRRLGDRSRPQHTHRETNQTRR